MALIVQPLKIWFDVFDASQGMFLAADTPLKNFQIKFGGNAIRFDDTGRQHLINGRMVKLFMAGENSPGQECFSQSVLLAGELTRLQEGV